MATKVQGRCYTNKREVRSMKLKMFLSDYQYRQMLMKDLTMKITGLPIVKQVYHHYRINRFKKENKNLDGWECYVKLLQIEEGEIRGVLDNIIKLLQSISYMFALISYEK